MIFSWFHICSVNTIDTGGNGVPPLSPLLQNPLVSSYSFALPSRIYSWTRPQLPKILVLFSSSLEAGSLWIFLALDTLSSHVLADCISNSGPADWRCDWAPPHCTSIWVALGLDSLSLHVLKCYTPNSYSAHWLCNRNISQTTCLDLWCCVSSDTHLIS